MLLLLGAGASAHFKVPLFSKITKNFYKDANYSRHKIRIKIMENEFKRLRYRSDIETYLSYAKAQLSPRNTLMSMHPFVNHFIHLSNSKKLNYDPTSIHFIHEVEDYIYKQLFKDSKFIVDDVVNHYDGFLNHCNTRFQLGYTDIKEIPLDIFTTNYDNLIELYCDEQEIDMFSGYKPQGDGFSKFDIEEYESPVYKIKLYKIHGSVTFGRVRNSSGEIKIFESDRGVNIGDKMGAHDEWEVCERIMVYGNDKNPTRNPYFQLLRALTEKLKIVREVVVIGFSFEDTPILNIFKNRLDENDDISIYLLTRNADIIKKNKFDDSPRVIDLPGLFDEYSRI